MINSNSPHLPPLSEKTMKLIDTSIYLEEVESLIAQAYCPAKAHCFIAGADNLVMAASTDLVKSALVTPGIDPTGKHFEEVFCAPLLSALLPTRDKRTTCILKKKEFSVKVKGLEKTYRIFRQNIQSLGDYTFYIVQDLDNDFEVEKELGKLDRGFDQVLHKSQDHALILDTNWNIMGWSLEFENATGFDKKNLAGKEFFDLFPGKLQSDLFDQKILLDVRYSTRAKEFTFVGKNGSYIHTSLSMLQLRDKEDKPRAILVMMRFLNDLKQCKTRLIRSQKLTALGVMAEGIAHEIRNPLTAASAAAQFLMQTADDPTFIKECSDRIYTGICKISTTIDDLLRFARTSYPLIDVEVVNIVDVIRESVSFFEANAKAKNIIFKVSLPDYPLKINGKHALLQQMMVNLLLNSILTMPDGGIIKIDLETHDGKIELQIRDSGEGIAESVLENIFVPFFSMLPAGQGEGLGLSLCYSIIKQHLGEINVDSIIGKGTVFSITLPLV